MTEDHKELVRAAQRGSQPALEALIRDIQDNIFKLATRMLVNRDDALEATQEILILVVTKLSTFKGDSAFNTWVFRVATNYLLTARKVRQRDLGLTFDAFGEDLESGLVVDPAPAADDLVMLNELRISCTMAMLLCLDIKHRVAYVLGDIMEFDHAEAAEILDISKQNYRKRLSRARSEVVNFTSRRCGLANDNAKCSCPRRLPAALASGRIDPQAPVHADSGGPSYEDVVALARQVEGELKTLKLQTAVKISNSPNDFGSHIAKIVDSRLQ